jgi:hypothetical protein
VAGRVGPEPPSFPLKVVGRDLDTGKVTSSESLVASEFEIGDPSGGSPLRLVGGLAIAGTGIGVLGGSPSRESGVMCLKVELVGVEKPLRFCNRYVGRGFVVTLEDTGLPVPVGRMLADYSRAIDLLESYEFGAIKVKSVEASLKMRRGIAGAQIVGVRAPSKARRGSRIRVTLLLRRAGGGRTSVTFPMRVPRSLRRGLQPLTVTGPELNEADSAQSELIFDPGAEEGAGPPTTLEELRASFDEIRRYDGVLAELGTADVPSDVQDFAKLLDELLGGAPGGGRPAYRHPTLRISGTGATAVQILP